jgi:hypothetical protein
VWLQLLAVIRALAAEPDSDASGELRWVAPPQCPSQTQMRQRIAEAGGTGGLRIDATPVRGSDDTWRLQLSIEFDGHEDHRTLEGPDCAALADALELLIAVRRDEVEPDDDEDPGVEVPQPEVDAATTDTEAPPADDTVETSPPTTLPPPEVPRAPRAAGPEIPQGLHLGVAAGLGLGSMPVLAVPIEVGLGWSFARWRLAARGRYIAPRRATVDDGRSALLQMGTGGIEACGRPAVRTVEFPLCGQASMGGSRADPRGGGGRTRGGLWGEAGVDVGLAWHFTPQWALTARLGAAAVLAKTRYVVADQLLFDPAPVVGRLVVGVETHIPIQIGRRPENGG